MNSKSTLVPLLLLSATLLVALPSAAQGNTDKTQASEPEAGTLEVGVGFDATSGKYGGTVRIDERSVPLVVRYKRGRMTYKLSIPFVRVTGPADVVRVDSGVVICDESRSSGSSSGSGSGNSGSGSGSGGSGSSGRGSLDDCESSVPGATTAATRTTRSGLGDVQIEVAYEVPEIREGGPTLEVISKIKLGTASTRKGLGTGTNAYSVQVDAAQPFGDNALLAGVGYRVYEKITGTMVKNTPFFSFGGKRQLSDTTSLKVVYERRQPVEVGTSHAAELTATLESQWRAGWRMEAYLFKGLSKASADVGAGFVVARQF